MHEGNPAKMLEHFFPLLAYSTFALSSPHQLSDTSGDADLTGTVYIPTPSTSTVFAATTSTTTNPNMTNPINIKKFFDVSTKCTPAHQAFYKKAYEGAATIANAARKRPVYGTAGSDLYFGSNAEDNALLVNEVPGVYSPASYMASKADAAQKTSIEPLSGIQATSGLTTTW